MSTYPNPLPARSMNSLLATVLLVGPVATVTVLARLIETGHLSTLSPAHYLVTALLFWSPLPFSLPAVMLEAHRDAALPHLRGMLGWPLRAVLLVPWLLFAPRSTARGETLASLTGFVVAAAVALPLLL